MARRLLLDTHTFIWAIEPEAPNLPQRIIDEIEQADEVYVSAASIWEIAIKSMIPSKSAPGQMKLDVDPAEAVEQMKQNGFLPLSVSYEHAVHLKTLPPSGNGFHGDPFDRLLVVQASCEDLELVTCDAEIHKYEPPVTTVKLVKY